jgi:hypothetical protein
MLRAPLTTALGDPNPLYRMDFAVDFLTVYMYFTVSWTPRAIRGNHTGKKEGEKEFLAEHKEYMYVRIHMLVYV